MSPELQDALDRINARQEATAAMVVAGAAELVAITLFIGAVLIWAAIFGGAA